VDIQRLFINKDTLIREAIEKLDKTAQKILIVVENKKLIGVVTDGDIRRWILKSGDLSSSVKMIMNTTPVYLNEKNKAKANEIMKKFRIESIPLVNEYNEVIDVIFWNDLYDDRFNYFNTSNIPVVIMAGGKGTRLQPYTKIIPKALIPIGDIPIVERIINKFLEFKFSNFYISINDKKEIIKAYFNQELSYNIYFIEEGKPLGTAGSLNLLNDNTANTFFVSNCDILVEANYSKILEYHKDHNNKITVVTALKNYTIPYGVFSIDKDGDIQTIDEKPNCEFLVNTGMYVLEKEALKYIPKNIFFNMTDLILECLSKGDKVGTYPVTDNDWLDMGEFKELKNMMEKLKF
jgi:dTDP-glucose pyrophosphorylase